MAKPLKKATSEFDRYRKATDDIKPRLIGLSDGEPGSRKTSFWLEGPGPIVVFSLDQGLEGVVERYQHDKDIYVKEYEWLPTEETSQEDAQTLRNDFISDFEHAIQHARTVIIDKETDLWELFRYAEFGAPKDSPLNYPALNQRYRRIINMPKATNINFGCIDGMKDEWVPKINKKTGAQGAASSGARIRAGFKELDGLVHIVLHHRGLGPDSWEVEVGKARGPAGFEVAGATYPYTLGDDESLTFSKLGQMIFPDSDESTWSS